MASNGIIMLMHRYDKTQTSTAIIMYIFALLPPVGAVIWPVVGGSVIVGAVGVGADVSIGGNVRLDSDIYTIAIYIILPPSKS